MDRAPVQTLFDACCDALNSMNAHAAPAVFGVRAARRRAATRLFPAGAAQRFRAIIRSRTLSGERTRREASGVANCARFRRSAPQNSRSTANAQSEKGRFR